MLKTINVLFIALFLIQGVIACRVFSEETVLTFQAVPHQEAEITAESKKSARRKEEKGIDLARQSIEMADPYPDLKESVKEKTEEIEELTRKKTALRTMIQRTKVDMNKKATEFANNPRMLEITKKLYTKKINEMQQEYAEIEQFLPKLHNDLAENTIELQAEDLTRSRDKDTSNGADDAFEQAVLERFQNGSKLLNKTHSYSPYH